MRNAIYRDLIFEQWPVFYSETNRALVYYFGYWLLPSAACKLFLPILNDSAVWIIARVFIFIYSFFFILCIETVIVAVIRKRYEISKIGTVSSVKISIILTVWGTLSVLGIFFSQPLGFHDSDFWKNALVWPLSIEHWAESIGVENNNLIQVMNVYNQCIPAWLGVFLFLLVEKDIEYYGIICFTLAIVAPIPMLGLILMMSLKVAIYFVKKDCNIKKILSIENVLSLSLIIITALFYKGGASTSLSFKPVFDNNCFVNVLVGVILLSFFCYGAYAILCEEMKKKDFFFIGCIIINVMLFFICIGGTGDFTMRASIPVSMFFMICAIGLLLSTSEDNYLQRETMCFLLGLTAVVPLLQVGYLSDVALDNGRLGMENDYLYTLSNLAGDGDDKIIHQYTKINPSKDFFFSKLSKGDFKLNQPVLQYKESNDGGVYVESLFMTSNMKNKVVNNTTLSKEDIARYLDKKQDGEVISLIFGENEVKPIIESNLKNITNDQIDIEWLNAVDTISTSAYGYYAAVRLSNNTGKDIRYCNKRINEQCYSGISVEIVNSEENIVYPYAYSYTKHVIYDGDSELYIVRFPELEKKGKALLRFCFFYTDENGNNVVVHDKKIFEVNIE